MQSSEVLKRTKKQAVEIYCNLLYYFNYTIKSHLFQIVQSHVTSRIVSIRYTPLSNILFTVEVFEKNKVHKDQRERLHSLKTQIQKFA